jgi:hypothetical protein
MRSMFQCPRRRVIATALIALVAASAGAAAVTQTADATVATLATFTTPGSYVWTVPTGVTAVTFDVYGARGGGVIEVLPGPTIDVISSGGAGGEAKGRFTVHGGEKFEIVVGGQGGAATVNTTQGTAGFNGGGSGGPLYGGGGGGGSDVRLGGRGNPCATSKSCGYGDRIIAGGGGGGGANNSIETDGDRGGGLTGCCFTPGNMFAPDATQERGGICNLVAPNGTFGVGGSAPTNGNIGAGGGGGWYGGCSLGMGGGGSGFVSGISKSGSFPGGTNAGDGKVIITT